MRSKVAGLLGTCMVLVDSLASGYQSCDDIHVTSVITSDMQGMVWGEPELSHVWEFDHMVFFHSHK